MIEGILIFVLWLFFEIFIMPRHEGRGKPKGKYGVREWALFPVEYERDQRRKQESHIQSIPKEPLDEARYF